MVSSFLRNPKMVTGVFEEGSLTLWVDSEMTKGILSRPNSLPPLEQAAEAYCGQKQRIVIKVGKPESKEPPEPKEEDNFDGLLDFGRQFGNFTVK